MHHCDLRLPLKKINLMYSTALFLKNISPPNGGFYVIVRVELEGDGEMYFGYILLNLEISCSARIRTLSTCVEYPANIGERYQATTQRSRCPKKEQFAFHYLVVTFQNQWNRQHLLSRYACLEACCQWHPYLSLSYLLEEDPQN